jgi:2-polyprenyl-3-methyl-5-hydroxy-6-metoxy-1,4-benzoquinol methylase
VELLIYIPTYKRLDLLNKQLHMLYPQLKNHHGKVKLLVSINDEDIDAYDPLKAEFGSDASLLEFRENPSNIHANANIALGFVLSGSPKYLWILSDDDIVLQNSIELILEQLSANPDFLHLGDYDEAYVEEKLTCENIFSVPKGGGFGLISVVISRFDFIKHDIYQAFEYIESSFPHFAVYLAAVKRSGQAELLCVPSKYVFAFEGALSDGDYIPSKLGFLYLADFIIDKRQFLRGWLSANWYSFFDARTQPSYINTESRYLKALGYMKYGGINLMILIYYCKLKTVIIKNIKRRLMLKNFVKRVFCKFNKEASLGNNGERLDLMFSENLKCEDLDRTQISHVKRYQFASSLIRPMSMVGDFACGTGYGSAMLASGGNRVLGIDISEDVILELKRRYARLGEIEFQCIDLLKLNLHNQLDYLVSFETVEHLWEKDIPTLFKRFYESLKSGGCIILSTPYLQETPPAHIELNYHLTHEIDDIKITKWLGESGFEDPVYYFQDFDTQDIDDNVKKPEMIICVAWKPKEKS